MGFLAKDVAIYGAASAANKLLAVIAFPILTRHFGAPQYGAFDYLNFVVAFLVTLVVLGQDSAIARYFYEHEDVETRRQIVSQSLLIQLAVAAVAVVALLLIAPRVALPIDVGRDPVLLLALVVLHIPFLVASNFAQNILKWTFRRQAFILVTLGQAALYVALLLAAVFWLHVGLAGVFAVSLTARAAFALLGLWLCRGWLARPRGRAHVAPLVAFAVPFGIIGAVGAFVPVMERSTVALVVGQTGLGVYAAGAAVAMLISLPIQAFQTAWGPFSLAIHKESGAAESYDHILKAFAFTMCLSAIGLAALAPVLVAILTGGGFEGAAVVVFPLVMGLVIQSISWVTEIGISISKRSHLQLYAYASFLVVAAAGVLVLPHRFGILGVALGVMLGHVAKALVASYLAERAHPLRWSYLRVSELVVATLILGALTVYASRSGPALGLAAGSLGALGLALFAWARLLTTTERGRLLRAVGFL